MIRRCPEARPSASAIACDNRFSVLDRPWRAVRDEHDPAATDRPDRAHRAARRPRPHWPGQGPGTAAAANPPAYRRQAQGVCGGGGRPADARTRPHVPLRPARRGRHALRVARAATADLLDAEHAAAAVDRLHGCAGRHPRHPRHDALHARRPPLRGGCTLRAGGHPGLACRTRHPRWQPGECFCPRSPRAVAPRWPRRSGTG